jgi:hypothetical protein
MKINKPWWWWDAAFITGIVLVAAAGIAWVRPGQTPAHILVRPAWQAIMPPGMAGNGSGLRSALPPTRALVAVPIHKNLLLAIAPDITFACDIGAGGYDGVNFYESGQQGNYTLIQTFGATNVFPVSLDTNWPHFVEVRTFIHWPAPGVIQTFTNDDGSTTSITNTFYEGVVADYLWVPAGMTNQWLAQLADGSMQLIGWGTQGATYTVKRGDTLQGPWDELGTIPGTNGPWMVPDDGTSAQRFFWTTVTN